MSEKKWFDDGLLINIDPGWCLIGASTEQKAKEMLKRFFKMFTEHKITDVQLCVFENTSLIPSDIFMWRGDKYLQKEENGSPVSYPELEGLYNLYRVYDMEDPVQMFIDLMNKSGVRPWITMRMNDAHCNWEKTSVLRDDFYYTAKKNGWMIGKQYGYFSHCLDYAYPQVRERMLAYIKEVMSKYDAFGVELDFMREVHCFDYKNTPERHQIMSDFILRVREMLDELGERRGHKIHIMIRSQRSVEEMYEFGFDIGLWAKKGWIDAVVPSPRFDCNDDAIPVAQWKALVGQEVAVFPCLEILHLRTVSGNRSRLEPEIAKAYSASWNAQDADGIYYYNHYYPETEHDQQMYGMRREDMTKGRRRYILTWQDLGAGSIPLYAPLPAAVDQEKTLSLQIGPVENTDEVTLIIEFEGEQPPIVVCNGRIAGEAVKCAPVKGWLFSDCNRPTVCEDLTGEQTYIYDCKGLDTEGQLYLTFHGNGKVKYVEVAIEKKDR